MTASSTAIAPKSIRKSLAKCPVALTTAPNTATLSDRHICPKVLSTPLAVPASCSGARSKISAAIGPASGRDFDARLSDTSFDHYNATEAVLLQDVQFS